MSCCNDYPVIRRPIEGPYIRHSKCYVKLRNLANASEDAAGDRGPLLLEADYGSQLKSKTAIWDPS